MDDVTIVVEGGPELARAFSRAQAKVSAKALQRELSALAAPLVRAQRSAAPFDPAGAGVHLRQAVGKRARIGTGRTDTLAAVTVGVVRKDQTAKGLAQEYGTTRHAAQPFLRPDFEARRGNLLRALEADIRRRLESLGGGA